MTRPTLTTPFANRRTVGLTMVLLVGLWLAPISMGHAQEIQTSNALTVYLIRHAEKRLDQGDDPELSAKGLERADLWAKVFSIVEIDAVFSTNTIRTQATAAPIALEHNLSVQNYSPLPSNVEEFIAQNAGNTIVMVGHSNTIAKWTNALTGQTTFADLADNEYDSLFVVNITDHKKSARRVVVPLD